MTVDSETRVLFISAVSRGNLRRSRNRRVITGRRADDYYAHRSSRKAIIGGITLGALAIDRSSALSPRWPSIKYTRRSTIIVCICSSRGLEYIYNGRGRRGQIKRRYGNSRRGSKGNEGDRLVNVVSKVVDRF